MSFAKARERRLEEPMAAAPVDASKLCDVPGCRSWWTVNISHGRKCALHERAAERASAGLPPAELIEARLRRAPVRPFSEMGERDLDAEAGC